MVKITFDLNEPKDSSKNDKAAQNGRTLINVDEIDKFCLHDLKDMIVKLVYGFSNLMYYHFLISRLGLDYGMHPLNVDADVLEMAKYVKDYKIILVYVERESSIFVTPKKGVAIAVDNHLRKCPIEIDSSPDVNRNLTPMCHRNLTKEWEHVSSISPLSIGEAMKKLSKNSLLVTMANTRKQITGNEITGKQMVVHVGRIESFKEVEVDADNESEKESDTEADYTSGSNSEDSDYDPEQDEVFDDDEHIVEDVHDKMNLMELRRIGKHKERVTGRVRMHSVETRRKLIMVKNNKERVRVRCEGTIPALVPYVAIEIDMGKSEFSQTKGGPVIRENSNSNKQNILGKDKTCQGKGKKVNKQKKVDRYSCPWTMLVAYTNEGRWEVRTLIEDHNCLQSREIKACTSRFLSDHIIKSLATNPDIPVRAVQDQM
ncbi:hypothetical protein Tco_0318529 [Tanacetum coccineum]